MIVSHEHKFIFCRPTKTGSSSAQAMVVEAGILNPETDFWSGYRNDVRGKTFPGNKMPRIGGADVRKISPYRIPARLFVQDDGELPLVGHMTPIEMQRLKLISQEMLETYTVISIFRHPIDRFISAWFFYRELLGLGAGSYNDFREQLFDNITEVLNPFLGRSMQDYGFYESQYYKEGTRRLIPNMVWCRTDTLISDLENILSNLTKKPITLEPKTFKSAYRPEWARGIYWLKRDEKTRIIELQLNDWSFYCRHYGDRSDFY